MASPCDGGVDDGVLAERLDGGARDERHVGELDAVALLVLVLFFFAQLDDARHVHLEDGVDVGVGVLGLDHALGDDGAHLGHGDELAGLRLRSGGLGRSGRAAGAAAGRLSACGCGAAFEVAEDVLLGDAAGGAGAGDGGEIDVVFCGDLADERRGALAFAGCGGSGGRSGCAGLTMGWTSLKPA